MSVQAAASKFLQNELSKYTLKFVAGAVAAVSLSTICEHVQNGNYGRAISALIKLIATFYVGASPLVAVELVFALITFVISKRGEGKHITN